MSRPSLFPEAEWPLRDLGRPPRRYDFAGRAGNLVSLRSRAARVSVGGRAWSCRCARARGSVRRRRCARRSGHVLLSRRARMALVFQIDAGAQHAGVGRCFPVGGWRTIPLAPHDSDDAARGRPRFRVEASGADPSGWTAPPGRVHRRRVELTARRGHSHHGSRDSVRAWRPARFLLASHHATLSQGVAISDGVFPRADGVAELRCRRPRLSAITAEPIPCSLVLPASMSDARRPHSSVGRQRGHEYRSILSFHRYAVHKRIQGSCP